MLDSQFVLYSDAILYFGHQKAKIEKRSYNLEQERICKSLKKMHFGQHL